MSVAFASEEIRQVCVWCEDVQSMFDSLYQRKLDVKTLCEKLCVWVFGK